MRIHFCNNCGGSLTRDSRFCGHCGHQTEESRVEARERSDAERADLVARGGAMAVIFVGSIAGMIAINLFLTLPPATIPWVVWLADIGICAAAAWWIGGASLRHSFGRSPDSRSLILACLVPVASLAVAYGYVEMLPRPEPGSGETPSLPELLLPYRSMPALLLVVAVMPALVEEWMCRGVLWVALRPISTRWTTIAVTAVLFAFLHGLNGGFILELPHRFVMGLMLGWLRATTGSLWPCVIAHFLHNGTAVWLDGA